MLGLFEAQIEKVNRMSKSLKSNIVTEGDISKPQYPCVKRWYPHLTFALFSTCGSAVIIAVDPAHSHDFIGKKVDDPSDGNWIVAENFKIVISDF